MNYRPYIWMDDDQDAHIQDYREHERSVGDSFRRAMMQSELSSQAQMYALQSQGDSLRSIGGQQMAAALAMQHQEGWWHSFGRGIIQGATMYRR